MQITELLPLLRGPFSFLELGPEDLRRLGLDGPARLPRPQRIFLTPETATPAVGFPVLQTAGLKSLREALEGYVRAEEELELAVLEGHPADRRAANAAWSGYEALLQTATENAVSSSFGRGYPSIFWLFHSIAVSRLFKETPRRLRRESLALGKTRGDEVKYRVFHRYLDRVLQLTYEVTTRVAHQTEEEEKEIFPFILNRMRDNVLVLTEDHVSPDLGELSGYFNAYLRIDGREFRERMAALTRWHDEEIRRNQPLREAVRHLLQREVPDDAARLFVRPGYLTLVAETATYDVDRFLTPGWLEVWENLLLKLKEFELLASLRRLVVPTFRRDDGELTCFSSSIGRSRGGRGETTLSATTRPLDFMTPWVVDPLVERYGLIYDITNFSAIISSLRRAGRETQDDSYRGIFTFQRRVNRMARNHSLRLEKYLGDGAFYSGRYPELLLRAATRLQRYYRRVLAEGFPFDRGLRIAVNYGHYRLLPIEGVEGGTGHRYEFFGHGIVELTRLVTGKAMREIEDVKTLLLARGYSQLEVERFFAPVARHGTYLRDKAEEARPFYAYVNSDGVLINEGIVATQAFLERMDASRAYELIGTVREGSRSYIAARLEDEPDPLVLGFRQLGEANLKGLGDTKVFEVVDGAEWPVGVLDGARPSPTNSLLTLLERQFETLTRDGAQLRS
ncbi:MAG: hypothetical protein R3325_07000 [Thermoanaerobaculia bacterium]|nr:hypothetical protein [Thermoanaerobaculia bacterium]